MPRKSSKEKIPKLTDMPKSESDFNSKFFVKDYKSRVKNTQHERVYQEVSNNVVNFVLGVVGTGKSHLASHVALKQLHEGLYDGIIVLRPAVSTEEHGYFPGTMEEKIAPYVESIIAPLRKIVGAKVFEELIAKEIIKVDMVGVQSGRSYDKKILLIDEIENLTRKQLRTLLTRIEDSSKIILCGDTIQCELDDIDECATMDLQRFIGKKSISFNIFTKKDIVRGKITKLIDSCYEKDDNTDIIPDFIRYKDFLNKGEDIGVYEYEGHYQ
jgi:phosphate starvation-inducible PhoH-like protein